MHHWDRNTIGRLERVSAPLQQGCEVSLQGGQMELIRAIVGVSESIKFIS